MKLAVLKGPRQFEVTEADVPSIGPDEVLIKVAACGVCASELDMWQGESHIPFPIYPGHEVSGVVERVGAEVAGVAPGAPVGCWVTGHGFSEYVAVRAEHCLPAGDVPLELALAEPLACAVNAVELADVRLGDDVLIIGGGFMGALVLKLVALRGPRRVIVADTRPEVLERARALGATHTIDVTRQDMAEVVRSLTDRVPAGVHADDVGDADQLGVDVAFEVTGVQAPLLAMGDATRMSGKIVIVGYHQGDNREIPLAQWNWKAFHVINAHFREVATIMRGMRIGMRLLAAGIISLDDLVTHRFTLDQVDDAFAVAVEKPEGFVKSTVLMEGTPT
jgi:threonine dehydrogenase-like Zn-dependent dehydrogenase